MWSSRRSGSIIRTKVEEIYTEYLGDNNDLYLPNVVTMGSLVIMRTHGAYDGMHWE